jgi:hypothetical protein
LTWDLALERFLDGLYDRKKPEAATHRPATRKDYASKLQTVELNRFRGRPVAAISREEIAEAVNATCARAYDMGCGSLRSLNQRPDTLMQDRICQVDETSCNARPDHTFGSCVDDARVARRI